MITIPTSIATPETVITKKQKRSMTLDNLYSVSQALAVAFGVVALLTGFVVNKRQARQLLTMETNLEEQRQKTEEAKQATLELHRQINNPRHLDWEKAKAILEGKPTHVVKRLSYNTGSSDAQRLAMDLHMLLTSAGWPTAAPTKDEGEGYVNAGIDFTANATFFLPEQGAELGPEHALQMLLQTAIIGNTRIGFNGTPEDDEVTIRIGPKF